MTIDAVGRTRRVAAGSVAMLFSRFFTMALSFVTIGVVARRLSPEAFGIWSIMSTFAIFAGSFDFGLGQGLRNRLATLYAESPEDGRRARELFSAVFLVLLLFSLLLAAVVAVVLPQLPWGILLGIREPNYADVARWAVTLVVALLLVNLPLNLYAVGFLAYQEAVFKSLVEIVQAVALFLFTLVAVRSVSLLGLVSGYYLVFNLVALLGMIAFLLIRRWQPRFLSLRRSLQLLRSILGDSLAFWILGVSAIALFTMDPLIVSRLMGADEAGRFSVYQRLFTMLIALHFTLLNPLWSAYTHAMNTNDFLWMRVMMNRTVKLTLGVSLAGAGLIVVAGPSLIRLWTAQEPPERLTLALLALWVTQYAWINCFSVILNGMGIVRGQAWVLSVSAVAHMIFSVLLGQRYGVNGIVWGAVISLLPMTIYAPWAAFRGLNRAFEAVKT